MRLVAVAALAAWACLLSAPAPVESSSSTTCSDRAPQALFNTITAYELVCAPDSYAVSREDIEGCHPVFYWHMVRHGTRNPSKYTLRKLNETLPELQTQIKAHLEAGSVTLCTEDAEKIINWTLSEEVYDNPDALTDQGEDDVYDLAMRMRTRLPHLIGDHPDPDTQYLFRATASERTVESAEQYGSGISSQDETLNLTTPIADDPLIEFYKHCGTWVDAVWNNDSLPYEVTKFIESNYTKAALKRVSTKLGFSDTLSYEKVTIMHEACSYWQSFDPTVPAVWCAAFETEDLLVFEYIADLYSYYMMSYGNELSVKLGSPLINDLVTRFFDRITGGTEPTAGVVYVGHDSAIQLTLTALGVGNDSEPLTTDNYETMKTNRSWSLSKLVPMAANIAFVLYECPYGTETYMIKPFLNEITQDVNGCNSSSTLCSWNTFYSTWADIVDDYSTDWCATTAATSATTASTEASATTTTTTTTTEATTASADSTTKKSSSAAALSGVVSWPALLAAAAAASAMATRGRSHLL